MKAFALAENIKANLNYFILHFLTKRVDDYMNLISRFSNLQSAKHQKKVKIKKKLQIRCKERMEQEKKRSMSLADSSTFKKSIKQNTCKL